MSREFAGAGMVIAQECARQEPAAPKLVTVIVEKNRDQHIWVKSQRDDGRCDPPGPLFVSANYKRPGSQTPRFTFAGVYVALRRFESTTLSFTLVGVSSTPPRAPASLAERGSKLWKSVLAAYVLTPGELAVLEALCHAVDQLAKINGELVSAPLVTKGSRGHQIVNPLYAQARQHAKTVESLQRALCLPEIGQNQGTWRNPHRKSSVDERWRRAAKARDNEGA